MCLRKIPTRLRYNQEGISRERTGESLGNISEQRSWTRSSWRANDCEPTREFHYSKLGLESWERSIGAGGVTLSPINPPLHQTKQTGRRHPGNELTFIKF